MSDLPADAAGERQQRRRRSSRVRLYLPAILETLTDRSRASICNLSTVGAQVEVDPLPVVGADVLLKCGSIDALCRVVRVDDNSCGLEFEEPVTDDQIVSARRLADRAPEVQQSVRIAAARAWYEGR